MESSISEPSVVNWDSIIHKGARTKEGRPLGYIAGDDEEFIYVLSSGSREYRIPKLHVVGFDGSVVLLDLQFEYLEGYEIH